MKESKIGFRPPGADLAAEDSLNPAESSDKKLTIVLPREQYDRLLELARRRSIQRGEEPIMTTAIAGESHPLRNLGRGVR